MPRFSNSKITKSTVDSLKPGETIWDSQLSGFGVRAGKNKKSYIVKTQLNGKQTSITIGAHGVFTPSQARDEAMQILANAKKGIAPTAAKKPKDKSPTLEAFCTRYLADHAVAHKKASSAHMDAANIKNHIIPLIGNQLVSEVRYSDIEQFKRDVASGKTAVKNPSEQIKLQGGGSVATGGTGVSNRCLALLSKLFNDAIKLNLRPDNTSPVKGVTKFKENPKERFLTDDEFKRLWDKLTEMEQGGSNPYFVAAVRLLMFTGARTGEILQLKWEQIDFAQSTARLSDSKTGPKSLRLNQNAMDILKELPRINSNPYVIVGAKAGQPLVNIRKPWTRLRNEIGLPDVRLHDLRHTYASMALTEGLSLSDIQYLLGHKSPQTTNRYAHLSDEHIRAKSFEVGNILRDKLI